MNADKSFSVAIFGIPEFERELVERIFSVSESRDHAYRIVDEENADTAEIALVDISNASAADEFARFNARQQAGEEEFPTVIIANGKDPGSDFWVKRPFTAMRMLGALDKLVDARFSGAERPRPKPAAADVETPAEAPAEAPARTATKETPAAPAATPAPAAGTYKALVVDDSLPVRKQVGVALRRSGITAEFAEDAESALRLIESRSYDILFLDVVLPGKDGYEICKAVKRNKDKKHIPVIMLTGKSSPIDKVKGKLSGCDAYLTKPVSLNEFNQTLSKWLSPPLSFDSMADAT